MIFSTPRPPRTERGIGTCTLPCRCFPPGKPSFLADIDPIDILNSPVMAELDAEGIPVAKVTQDEGIGGVYAYRPYGTSIDTNGTSYAHRLVYFKGIDLGISFDGPYGAGSLTGGIGTLSAYDGSIAVVAFKPDNADPGIEGITSAAKAEGAIHLATATAIAQSRSHHQNLSSHGESPEFGKGASIFASSSLVATSSKSSSSSLFLVWRPVATSHPLSR